MDQDKMTPLGDFHWLALVLPVRFTALIFTAGG